MTDLALGESLDDTVRDYLETAKESADHLLELLNEILDFSRIEAGHFELEHAPFSPRRTIEQLVKTLSNRAYEKGLELIYHLPDDLPEQVIGDSLRLRQVLTNLIGNAIKFTAKGEIVLEVGIQNLSSDTVTLQFSVADTASHCTGNQEKIFAAFTQADARRLAASAVPALGWPFPEARSPDGRAYWLESQAGRGSTFCFTATLPVGRRSDGRERIASAGPERIS